MRFLQTFLIVILCFTFKAYAVDQNKLSESFKTAEEILAEAHNEQPTNCASALFSKALMDHSEEISKTDDEARVRVWAREVMQDPSVLEEVLNCPELQNIAENTTIIFTPVVYEFKEGDKVVRTVTINYSTQKKVLNQKIILSRKRSLPDNNPNPNLMDPENPGKYLNTEPAWYAIMVVQHDALKDFVGEGKNNTVSMDWIDKNIDSIYPHGYWCTSKSAWANDRDTINQVVREVVDIKDDTNDYYVAGDMNLEWVMYAEIAADIFITAATAGGGQYLTWLLKDARAGRTAKNFKTLFKTLRNDEHVIEYIKVTNQITRNEQAIEKINDSRKALINLRKQYKEALAAGKTKEADEILYKISDISNDMKNLQIADISGEAGALKSAGISTVTLTQEEQLAEKITEIEKATKELGEKAKKLSETHKTIQTYESLSKEVEGFNKYRRSLTAFKRPQTGNVITRNIKKIWKAGRAANDGAKTMTRAGRVVRAGMSSRSAKIKDFLLDATLKHGSRLAKYESKLGKIYGAATMVKILGDMYDHTSSTSKEFSNGIEFRPLCLLSADDLKGQENVVNYGMWLMWQGNSTDPADDDAAYLQAMDFAAKFFYELDEFQDEHTAECNVDIYVVRPIIRLDESNPEDPHGELFYLFMNEIPWTTAEQFGEQVPDVSEWDRVQSELTEENPKCKLYKCQPEKTSITEDTGQIPEQVATNKITEEQAERTEE